MTSKDQAVGWLIFEACLAVAVWYTIALAFPSVIFGGINPRDVQMWYTAGVPVSSGLIAILAIGGWIGWNMATTLPPQASRRNRREGRSYQE